MRSAGRYQAQLQAALSVAGLEHVTVKLNANRVRVLALRGERSRPRLHVSRRLSELGTEGIALIVSFVQGKRSAREGLQKALTKLPPAQPPVRRSMRMQVEGEVYHLGQILEEVSLGLGAERPVPQITWGRRVKIRRGQRSIRLGCYEPKSRVIRIHRLLDDTRVPRWMLEYVIWHELLHDKHQVSPNGRWHSAHFKEEEASHAAYERAQIWLREELPTLMRAASKS